MWVYINKVVVVRVTEQLKEAGGGRGKKKGVVGVTSLREIT